MGKLDNLWKEWREYKGVKIYPFKMLDYDLFEELITILMFEKNNIPEKEIIKMSYLMFLLSVVPAMVDEKGKKPYEDVPDKLERLLSYILKDQKYEFIIDSKKKIYISITDGEKITTWNERDFDKVKNIILEQNAVPSIDDDNMHPDLKQELQEAQKFLAERENKNKTSGDIEDQVTSYKCEMGFDSYEPIKNMTVYQFRKELGRLNLIKDYQIYKTAECSGMVTFKKSFPHWLSHISDKPDYSDLLMSRKEFDEKMKEAEK